MSSYRPWGSHDPNCVGKRSFGYSWAHTRTSGRSFPCPPTTAAPPQAAHSLAAGSPVVGTPVAGSRQGKDTLLGVGTVEDSPAAGTGLVVGTAPAAGTGPAAGTPLAVQVIPMRGCVVNHHSLSTLVNTRSLYVRT